MRKIIRITGTSGTGLIAVCDDGTVWIIYRPDDPKCPWIQVKEIPQEEYAKPKV